MFDNVLILQGIRLGGGERKELDAEGVDVGILLWPLDSSSSFALKKFDHINDRGKRHGVYSQYRGCEVAFGFLAIFQSELCFGVQFLMELAWHLPWHRVFDGFRKLIAGPVVPMF